MLNSHQSKRCFFSRGEWWAGDLRVRGKDARASTSARARAHACSRFRTRSLLHPLTAHALSHARALSRWRSPSRLLALSHTPRTLSHTHEQVRYDPPLVSRYVMVYFWMDELLSKAAREGLIDPSRPEALWKMQVFLAFPSPSPSSLPSARAPPRPAQQILTTPVKPGTRILSRKCEAPRPTPSCICIARSPTSTSTS